MAATLILKRMLSLRCEHGTSSNISLTDSDFEILSYVLKKTNGTCTNIGIIYSERLRFVFGVVVKYFDFTTS